MTPDRALPRLFLVIALILGGLAAVASGLLQSWLPLLAVGVVLLGVTVLTLSEATLFAPLLALVMRAGNKRSPPSHTTVAATKGAAPRTAKKKNGCGLRRPRC
jgi:hypothetical protein